MSFSATESIPVTQSIKAKNGIQAKCQQIIAVLEGIYGKDSENVNAIIACLNELYSFTQNEDKSFLARLFYSSAHSPEAVIDDLYQKFTDIIHLREQAEKIPYPLKEGWDENCRKQLHTKWQDCLPELIATCDKYKKQDINYPWLKTIGILSSTFTGLLIGAVLGTVVGAVAGFVFAGIVVTGTAVGSPAAAIMGAGGGAIVGVAAGVYNGSNLGYKLGTTITQQNYTSLTNHLFFAKKADVLSEKVGEMKTKLENLNSTLTLST